MSIPRLIYTPAHDIIYSTKIKTGDTMFKPEKYTPPKFDREPFISFPDVTTEKAGDGYIPENFYATTIYPE